MTPVECTRLIVGMTTALPREWSFLTAGQQKATTALYCRLLADLPFEAACAAVERLLATAEKMPTIAAIRAATMSALHGGLRPGGEAWGDVRKLRAYRDRSDVAGIDPLVLRICDLYGWVQTRTLSRGGVDVEQWNVAPGDNETADRARFIELYDQLARTERTERNTSQLPAARAFRALQQQNQAALPPAPERPRQLGAMNARSDRQRPEPADFNRIIRESENT